MVGVCVRYRGHSFLRDDAAAAVDLVLHTCESPPGPVVTRGEAERTISMLEERGGWEEGLVRGHARAIDRLRTPVVIFALLLSLLHPPAPL